MLTLSGGGADTYTWDGGATDGVAFTPAGSGTIDFTVTGTDATSGCTGTATISIVIHENPDVTASASSDEICLGENVTLSGGGAATYVWDGGVTDGVAFPPASTGSYTYNVTGTSADGCEGTASVTISVIDCEPVIPNFSVPSPLCVGDCVTIQDESTGTVAGWSWNFGGATDPGTSTEQNPVICVDNAGTFVIELTTTSASGVEGTYSTEITVNTNPTVSATTDTIVDLGSSAMLVGSSASSGSYIWSPDRNLDCPTCDITEATPEETTTYTVVFSDENGCTASDTVLVLVNFVEGVGVPTAFSPNNDGENDILFVKGYALETIVLTVYNRYGEVVFYTTDQNIGWDGTFQNRNVNPGVFTWVLQYEFVNGNGGMKKGNTTLIR
jgi:gliding motility-associated-like protein